MDKSLYGKELARYTLNYLGGHEKIDAILMNPDIIIYEKGMVISSTLHKDFIYLRWDEIECVVYYKESVEKIEIDYGVVLAKRGFYTVRQLLPKESFIKTF